MVRIRVYRNCNLNKKDTGPHLRQDHIQMGFVLEVELWDRQIHSDLLQLPCVASQAGRVNVIHQLSKPGPSSRQNYVHRVLSTLQGLQIFLQHRYVLYRRYHSTPAMRQLNRQQQEKMNVIAYAPESLRPSLLRGPRIWEEVLQIVISVVGNEFYSTGNLPWFRTYAIR